MKGMILAAGLGTRLRPLTCFRAKPAIPVLNRPLIRYSMDLLRGAGVEEIVINLHHLPETVRQAAGDDPGLVYSLETETVLGTAGAVANVRHLLDKEPLILINGKVYFEQSLEPVIADHRRRGSAATLVVVPVRPASPFNPVFLDSEGRVQLFGGLERLFGRTDGPDLAPFIFTGVHILEPEVVERIPDGVSDTVRDLYPPLIREGWPIHGWISQARWLEFSTPERYLSGSLSLLESTGSEQDVIVDPTSEISSGAEIKESIVWGGIRVSKGCRLNRVILADGTGDLPAGTVLSDCVITGQPEGDFPVEAMTEGPEGRWVWPLSVQQ